MTAPGYWEGTVAPNLPAGIGSAVKLADKFNKLDFSKDTATVSQDVLAVAADAKSFVTSCAGTAISAMTDPLGWLINQGLGFLINICTPLKEALQLVSGDSDALTKAAQGFSNLGKEIVEFGKELSATLKEDLKDWTGAAADAARGRLGDFLDGVAGTADKAGDIAGLLHISSMLVKVAEEFIRGLLADLIEWLIITWLVALATAKITLGGSTAVAGAVTTYKVASTTVKTTQKVSRLTKLLNKIKELIAKLQRWLRESKTGQKFMDTSTGKGGKTLDKTQTSALDKAKKGLEDNKNKEAKDQRELTRDEWRDTLERVSPSAWEQVKAGGGQKLKDSLKEQGKKLIGREDVKTGKWDEADGKWEEKPDPAKGISKAAGYAKDIKKSLESEQATGRDQADDQTRRDLDL
ncbi:hypothetical protein M8C13_36755 [Crossiella sp. SN42]|uniref:hypothetical protein n=1 Tax=Crossiella sp. SN42 TaxID=2944808 RepID=UPI00207CF60A|nr:hypothetical protein [Crossiella sp. SN42]MCO1581316.1 hypothetical protein [Crossiella sp. SN42]